MNDDYLWNRTGSDPETEALERALAPLGYRERSAPLPAAPPASPARWRSVLALAAAAALLAGIFARLPGRAAPPPSTAFATDTEIDLGRYGSVTARAGARLTVLRQSDDEIRLRLDHGTVEARITLEARPRFFQIDTPATTCIDLGCHYTLTVDAAGRSVVHVTTGRVAFADGGREVYVPAGATCTAVPSRGSGTPHWDDAPPDLIAAVRAFDEAPPAQRLAAAKAVTRESGRPLDSLTVWHVMQDDDPAVADLGFRALVNLIGSPDGVTRASTLAKEPAAMEAWKEHVLTAWWGK